MLFFGKKKKKRQEELARQQEIAKQEQIKATPKPVAEPKPAPVEVVEKQEPKPLATPKPKTTPKPVSKAIVEEKKSPSGKYEVYPEAGMFKYRLKASNGEILAVSFGYSTRKGAKSGIETFKNAVEQNNFEISTDKSDFSHFDLFDARKARVIIVGEFYSTLKKAESAVESVRKFYQTEKVIDLDEIPTTEIREEVVPRQKIEAKDNGRFEIVKESEKVFFVKLAASNGQVLLVSQPYASKQTAVKGLETIKNAIEQQYFTTYKDKQGRFQYNLYSANMQLIVSGETYPTKQSCLSAIQSVLRFAAKAKTL